jgi:hypothetical protein
VHRQSPACLSVCVWISCVGIVGGDAPSPRSSHRSCAAPGGGGIYVFGGAKQDKARSAELHFLAIEPLTSKLGWRQCCNLAAAAAAEGVHRHGRTQRAQQLDEGAEVAGGPQARSAHAAEVIQGQLLVVGGYSGNGKQYADDAWALDLSPPSPTARRSFGEAAGAMARKSTSPAGGGRLMQLMGAAAAPPPAPALHPAAGAGEAPQWKTSKRGRTAAATATAGAARGKRQKVTPPQSPLPEDRAVAVAAAAAAAGGGAYPYHLEQEVHELKREVGRLQAAAAQQSGEMEAAKATLREEVGA